MLNESLNRFKLDSTSFQHFLRFQQCWTTSVFKRTEHLVQQSVEGMLKKKYWNRLNGSL